MSFSNSGGTLTIPSPSHVHHVDVGSPMRRSPSRSPSKFNTLARANSTVSNASQQSFNSQSSEGSGIFGGQAPHSPCPKRLPPSSLTFGDSTTASSIFAVKEGPSHYQQQSLTTTPFLTSFATPLAPTSSSTTPSETPTIRASTFSSIFQTATKTTRKNLTGRNPSEPLFPSISSSSYRASIFSTPQSQTLQTQIQQQQPLRTQPLPRPQPQPQVLQPYSAAAEPTQNPLAPLTRPAQQPQYTRSHTPLPAPPRGGARFPVRSAARNNRGSGTRRPSPKSPLKRALSTSSDSGNSSSTPSSTPPHRHSHKLSQEQENTTATGHCPPLSPLPARTFDRPNRHSMHLDLSEGSNDALFKLFESGGMAAPSASPLKRTDAGVDFGQSNMDSPVPKRRSVHGFAALSGAPQSPSIFGQPSMAATAAPAIDVHEDSNYPEYKLSGTPATRLDRPASPTPHHGPPRRTSSLRRSTNQPRIGGRDSWGRRHAHQMQMLAGGSDTPNARNSNRPRVAMDNFAQPRDSPFSAQPHPLSRAVAPPYSGSMTPTDTPKFIAPAPPAPANAMPPPAPKMTNFAQSLPLGSRPPMFPDSVQTPRFALSKRPVGAASTGLVSKMVKLPYEDSAEGSNKLTMPDTPCKKTNSSFATYPPQGSMLKGRPGVSILGETPFKAIPKPSGLYLGARKGTSSLFGRSTHNRSTRNNYTIDVDQSKKSDDIGADELPPTPTKVTAAHKPQFTPRVADSPTSRRMVPTSAVGHSFGRQTSSLSGNSKSGFHSLNALSSTSTGSPVERRVGRAYNSSPFVSKASSDNDNLASGYPTHSQVEGNIFPTPRIVLSPVLGSPAPCAPRGTNTQTVASPLDRFEFHHSTTPRTPHDVAPPDPSGLSISNRADGSRTPTMPPPATPTTRHDNLMNRRVITPVNSAAPVDVDEVLMGMFDKVEEIGHGEFSKVYRVAVFSRQPTPAYRNACLSNQVTRSPSSSPKTVFAVKRIKMPQGTRDRDAKLKEVNILRSLCHDNVLRYTCHWEEFQNLYIQTEFCEEGGMDRYLANIGKKGRLDDFRIWKMLLEIAAGLQHVHDCGFIHLDLKPANIFMTFDGILKIGDFGLAASWPANSSIEGEGDREYISPEALEGKFDKPADVYALGLIMMEIAGNVRLPGNGPVWRALRTGDMSDIPALTWNPIDGPPIVCDASSQPRSQRGGSTPFRNNGRRRLFDTKKSEEEIKVQVDARLDPPAFMEDALHGSSLDQVVRWMIMPDPNTRPTVHDVLNVEGSLWVSAYRRAGAAVFEGQWGPKEPTRPLPSMLTASQTPTASVTGDDDTEMMDV